MYDNLNHHLSSVQMAQSVERRLHDLATVVRIQVDPILFSIEDGLPLSLETVLYLKNALCDQAIPGNIHL